MIELNFYKNFLKILRDGNIYNWHERNSGNLTYRLTNCEVDEASSYFSENEEVFELGVPVPKLASKYFLVTNSGEYFSNGDFKPSQVSGIVKVLEDGKSYQKLFGFEGEKNPTSELPSHLLIQESFIKKDNKHRVVYHCHPTNLVALTFTDSFDSHKFTAQLWKMATECSVVIPRGIGILPWMMPGSLEIGKASSQMLEEFDMIMWANHGAFCTADSLDNAFGIIHVAEKAAEILVKVRSMNLDVKNEIKKEYIVDLADTFNIELNQKVISEL